MTIGQARAYGAAAQAARCRDLYDFAAVLRAAQYDAPNFKSFLERLERGS
jgi:hypothetical protein